MKTSELINHFGGVQETADAFGIGYNAVWLWQDKEHPPIGRQYEAQVLTKGKLKAEPVVKKSLMATP
jgi:hypothetical protein